MRTKTALLYALLLVTGIIIAVNFLSNRFFFRIDVTEDQRYSLSKATRRIIKSLEEPVTVTAYFSENLPPQYANLKRDFKDMLTEYQSLSKGMVAYEFIDPAEDEAKEQEIMQKGIVQAQIGGREKDEFKIQKAYMGAEVQMGNNSEVISILQTTQGMEYFLTTSIKKLSVQEKPLVGFLQGNGETGSDQLGHLVHGLSVLYDVQPVTLTDST
ncbi:MAG: GldG family protein [Bacteroidales bacterium]|nr:GldG family protein [Bacteroidales bacterium]